MAAARRAAGRSGGAGPHRRPALLLQLGRLVAVIALLPAVVAQSASSALAEADRLRRAGSPADALVILQRAAGAYPSEPLVHFNLGAVLGELGRHDEAARALRAGLELAPQSAAARLALGKVLVAAHRHAEALAELDRYAGLAAGAPESFDFHYARGLALRRLDRQPEARAALRRAVALDPDHADALFNLGAVLELAGEDGLARKYFEKAAGLAPGNPDYRYRLARLLGRIGEAQAGAVELDAFRELRAQQQSGSRISVLMRQAGERMQAGDADQAKQLYQEVIRLDALHAEAHANLGVAYQLLGRGSHAEAMFSKAVELRPDYAEARLNLGLSQAQSGRFREALASVSEAVRLSPGNLAAREALGMVLTRLGRPLDAVPHFRRLVEASPSSPQARLNLGIALAESGRFEEALAEFDTAAELAPDSFGPHYNRGRALNDLGRTDEARRALERAVELNGRAAGALHLLGTMERAEGNAQLASSLLARAAELDASNPQVHYDLGLAVSEARGSQAAVRHWKRVLELDPRHMEALYNLAQALQGADPARARAYRARFADLQAEKQDTDRAGALWNFALAASAEKRWEKAYDLFRQALEACGACPAKGQIHKNFGLVYAHAGAYDEAAAELAEAERFLPDDAEIRQALKVVRNAAASGR